MVYAHIINGVVVELFTPPTGFTIAQCFNPALIWVECDATPGVAPGWTYANGVFSAPAAPPAPTLSQQAAAVVSAGMTIALSGTVTLTGTLFPTDPVQQQKLAAVITTINATGAFPGGVTSYPMKDSSGAWHTFTVSQYNAVAGAIAAYVSALDLIADGNPTGATVLPETKVALTV